MRSAARRGRGERPAQGIVAKELIQISTTGPLPDMQRLAPPATWAPGAPIDRQTVGLRGTRGALRFVRLPRSTT